MRHHFSTLARAGLMAAGLVVALGAGEARAQSAACGDIGKILQDRKNIVERLQKIGKGGKIDARLACTAFGQLVTNGQSVVRWMDANASWCQVPDAFVENMKLDHKKSSELKAKACKVATQQTEMERRAKQAGANGQQAGGLLGGPGIEGARRMPQGAL